MAGGAETSHIAALIVIARRCRAGKIFLPQTPLAKGPFWPKWRKLMSRDFVMKTMSAREAKNAFGLMIDTARAEPVCIEKHGRGVVVVVSVEEYERLSELEKRTNRTTNELGDGGNAGA
jgi:prevent-host-death family protein